VIPQWVWTLIFGQIAGYILRKIGPVLRRAWSKLGNWKFWPVFITALILVAQWLRRGVNPATLRNFPPGSASPFPHLSLYAAPLLDILTYSWFGSLALSILYGTLKHLGQASWAQKLSNRSMKVTLLFYPAIVLWFSVVSEASFLIPSWLQTPLWLGSAYPLSLIVFRSAETLIGRKIFGKQGLVNLAVNKALDVARLGMQSIGEGIYGNVRYVTSRIRSQPFEVTPNPNVRPTIAVLFLFLTLASMTVAYELGYTSMLELFYAFGIAPYALAIACGVVGWRKRKRENEEKKRVVRVPKRLRYKFKFFSVMFDLLIQKDP
jgi:hypothetical protein